MVPCGSTVVNLDRRKRQIKGLDIWTNVVESHSPSDKRFNESKILSNITSFLQKNFFLIYF